MKAYFCLLLPILLLAAGCKSRQTAALSYQSQNLRMERLAPGLYIHTSYLDIPGYGKFPCNGIVYTHRKEALVFDTPVDEAASGELIRWVEQELKCTIKGVVVNHFHNDCLGGLAAFHERRIPSYAHRLTLALAAKEGAEVPENGFDSLLVLKVGQRTATNRYFGAGHSPDNIVSYFPREKALFGGCLVKSVGAGKGNLADADTGQWANTVRKVRQAYPKLQYVVPGHGRAGGVEFLDYTIELFSQERPSG